jgi:hypothetical protein
MRRHAALPIAAWIVFLVDAAGIAWLGIEGWLSGDPLGRAIALGVAELMTVPLAVLLAALAASAWWRSPVGWWICLALGVAPIILVLINIARHGA